jgi:hypothetical protein
MRSNKPRQTKREHRDGQLPSYDQFLAGHHPVHGIQFVGLLLIGLLLLGTGVMGFIFVLFKVRTSDSAPFYAFVALVFYFPVIYLGWLHLRRAFADDGR